MDFKKKTAETFMLKKIMLQALWMNQMASAEDDKHPGVYKKKTSARFQFHSD